MSKVRLELTIVPYSLIIPNEIKDSNLISSLHGKRFTDFPTRSLTSVIKWDEPHTGTIAVVTFPQVNITTESIMAAKLPQILWANFRFDFSWQRIESNYQHLLFQSNALPLSYIVISSAKFSAWNSIMVILAIFQRFQTFCPIH